MNYSSVARGLFSIFVTQEYYNTITIYNYDTHTSFNHDIKI